MSEVENVENIDELPDRVADTFKDRNILITGGTGFLGRVLVEKLLRTCVELDTIYLIVRTKKGKDPRQRMDDIFGGPLFEKVKKQRGLNELMRHCKPVAGDVGEPGLGLSPEDRHMLSERVHIIYHCAATIRFDESLKKAVLLNTRGTKYMLELAHECKNLLMYGHVSTSYCHLKEKVLHETIYDPPADPHKIIKCVEWMDEEIVRSITDKILGDLPNTYAFTKALGEGLVNEHIDTLPAVILRPSVVIPVWLEPLPGWTDNINGPTGLLIGAGKGVIRTMLCDDNGYADYLPVDITANGMLVAAWDFINNKEAGRRVYHLTSSAEYKVPWREIIELGRNIIKNKMPLNGVVWYPGGSMKSSRLHHNICMVLFHYIPAVLVDTILLLTGHKPILLRVQRRIRKGFEVFDYYAQKQWDFDNENAVIIRKLLNARERQLYKIDGNGIDLEEYFTECIHAARLHILNESDESLPAARRHMRVMWWVDKITKTLFLLFIFWMLKKIFLPNVDVMSYLSLSN